ncbi:twin-arginine translocase subunit TatB [Erythrobacter sp. SCSIO 43205]|uniref:Sec-independent protein translocase protein TatB n=1 Tax=Erythrobacter sp. SCSIO 43205 TaxID=2779361 RepID=UPI001CA8416E|nr:Sec-independent protein translocase protein TatB [Erythrobacter sp. SCSIO 43205]UAB79130.1 twin-arginine translocase subunit TatB [Erythrobacter sp. SCSIO 43205]
MFDLGAAEILVIIIVAVLVIGPKDMPLAMRHAGRWIGKVRRVSSHFRTGIDAMVREAELEDMEAKWKAQNEAIMKKSAEAVEAEKGEPVMTGPPPVADAESAAKKAKSVEPAPTPSKPPAPDTPAKPQD